MSLLRIFFDFVVIFYVVSGLITGIYILVMFFNLCHDVSELRNKLVKN